MSLAHVVATRFQAAFSIQPFLVRSSGRVNLIGEHTDYNGGWVLPAAIDKGVYIAFAPATSTMSHWISLDMNQALEVQIETPRAAFQSQKTWANYLLGVIEQFQKAGFHVPPFNAVLAGDLPIGAGLSSSAALESALAYGLNEVFGFGLSRVALAQLAQRAENEFVGMRCGIMDMFASLHGKADHALKLDCQTLDFQYVPLNLADYRIVLFDPHVKHSLVDSAYNTRRAQCEAGLAFFRQYFDESLPNLSAVPLAWLQASRSQLDPQTYARCQYVIEEHARIQAACEALARNDLVRLGRYMTATHQGLRYLYEVTTPELDFLADAVWHDPGVLGARIMGGGFGGCTINLIHKEAVETTYQRLAEAYQAQFGQTLTYYKVITANGTALL